MSFNPNTEVIVDTTSSNALLVRKDNSTGDVFIVDTSNNIVRVPSTIESSSTSTGALVISGGVGITKNLHVGGNISVTGTVDSRDVSVDGSTLDNLNTTIGLSALTSTEVDQLENIGTTSISATQWGYLGSLDQSLSTTSTPTFDATIIDNTSTTAFVVRRNGGGIMIFSVDTTNGQVNLGDTSLYGQVQNSGTEPLINFDSGGDFIKYNRTSNRYDFVIDSIPYFSINATDTVVSNSKLTISSTVDSTSITTGAVLINGGAGIAKNLFVGGTINSTVTTGTAPLVIASTTIIPNLNASLLGGATFASPGAIGSGTPSSGAFTTLSASGITIVTNTTTVGSTVNVTSSAGGALNVSGDVVLGASSPKLFFPSNGLAPPTFTNRSVGTKIVLFSNITGSLVDYAIGIENNTLWNSVPFSTESFKWYAGVTNIATLTGDGNMSLRQYTSTVTTGTAPLVIASTTNVPNLNASTLSGATFASPGAIGGSTPGSGAFTTISTSGQITSTGISASGIVTFTNTTQASTTSSGALIISGGVGIIKNLHVGGDLTITNNTGGGNLIFNDNNHAIYGRRGFDNVLDTLSFYEFGTIRFYTGGAIASQTQRMSISDSGIVQMEGQTVIDTTNTTALVVRKDSVGGDVFKVDSTNTRVQIGTTAANHTAMLSLYGPVDSINGPHMSFTTTEDAFPVMQIRAQQHNIMFLNFDRYWDGSFNRSSHSGSNFMIGKAADQLQFYYDSGNSQGSILLTDKTGFSMSNAGTVTFEKGVIIDDTSTTALVVRKDGATGDVLKVDTTNTRVQIGSTAANHASMLSLYGTVSSVNGPNIALTTTQDAFPNMQIQGFAHDISFINFDCYFNGTNDISCDIGSNFRIGKYQDELKFYYDSGKAQGATIGANVGMYMTNTGIFVSKQGIIVDDTNVTALTVRKDAAGGDVFTVNTTNTRVNIGPGTSNHSTLLSLYATNSSVLNGPNISVTTTADPFPLFHQVNYTHDNISLNFDAYHDGISGWKSSHSGSNFQLTKISNKFEIYYSSGIVTGGTITWSTGLSMSNVGNVTLPVTTTVGSTVNPTTATGGALNVSGDLVLGADKKIYLASISVAPPTFTTRSAGTQIVLYPSITGSTVDFAIGRDFQGGVDTIWQSVPRNNTTGNFKWYGGITEVMSLSGTGDLTLKSIVSASHITPGYSTIATAAGTTTLTVSSQERQYFTGTTTQTVVLPVTSTLLLGFSFTIVNLSTGTVTVQSSGANTISTVTTNTRKVYTCILTSGTTQTSWSDV